MAPSPVLKGHRAIRVPCDEVLDEQECPLRPSALRALRSENEWLALICIQGTACGVPRGTTIHAPVPLILLNPGHMIPQRDLGPHRTLKE